MQAIDVGPGAIDRESTHGAGTTVIDLANPANRTGLLASIEIWAQANMSGIKVATFYGSGTSYTPRDVVSLADVTAGSKVTRTVDASSDPIALSVEAGDYLGIYYSGGVIEMGPIVGSDLYYKDGDQTGAGQQTYTLLYEDKAISIYATRTASGMVPIVMWG